MKKYLPLLLTLFVLPLLGLGCLTVPSVTPSTSVSRGTEKELQGFVNTQRAHMTIKPEKTSISVEQGTLSLEPIQGTSHDYKVTFTNKNGKVITIPVTKPAGSYMSPAISHSYVSYPYALMVFTDFIANGNTKYSLLVFNLTTQKEKIYDIVTCDGASISDIAYENSMLYWRQHKEWDDACSGVFKKEMKFQ